MLADLEKTIEDIQSKLNIVDVISGYIPLKNAGRNFKGLCPFHNEKTPSFMVSVSKQIFHCFGCGAGGDMITFVMKYEKLEFIEALKILGEKAGVELPKATGSSHDGLRRSFASVLYRINELAANYYNAILIGSDKAVQARKYLAARSITAPTVAKFKLGYASASWDDLLKFAQQKGISLSVLEKAGLIIPGKEKSYYDRFRNRITFPIFDVRSNMVGLGGRVLDESLPKYMNSPETDVYIKGKHLYGLNFALDAIKQKDSVIIVEGYFDLIVPYQNGITNIVATLGTALTVEQIRLIKRFTNNVVIIFDSDEAGEAASLRGLDLLVSEGLSVKIARLPEGLDPDAYVRRNSEAAFQKLVDTADNLFDYKLKLLLARLNPAETEDKAKITAEMLPTIKRIENAVLRSDYMKRLSEILFIKEDALLEELSKVKLDYTYLGENRVFKDRTVIRPAEKILTGLIIEDVEVAQEVKGNLILDDFNSDDIKNIVKTVFGMIEEGKNPTAAKIIHKLNNENLNHIICEALAETESLIDRERAVSDCIHKIKKDNLKLKQEKLTILLREAEAIGDDTKRMELVKELNNLRSVRL